MTDTNELIERLRDRRIEDHLNGLRDEAADAIGKLLEENERLYGGRDSWKAEANKWSRRYEAARGVAAAYLKRYLAAIGEEVGDVDQDTDAAIIAELRKSPKQTK